MTRTKTRGDKGKKRKNKESENHALHEATHGQFGEEPRPEPMPNVEDKPSESSNIEDRIRAARKKSRTV